MKREDAIAALQSQTEGLEVYVTNGDLPPVPVRSISTQAADFGQMILISKDDIAEPIT